MVCIELYWKTISFERCKGQSPETVICYPANFEVWMSVSIHKYPICQDLVFKFGLTCNRRYILKKYTTKLSVAKYITLSKCQWAKYSTAKIKTV